MKLRELAEKLQCRLEGDGNIDIRRVAGVEHAQPGDITFIDSARYVPFLAITQASAVILNPGQALVWRTLGAISVLRSDHPYVTFARAVALFAPTPVPKAGIDPLSTVAADATIGPGVSIGPFVTVCSGASIGARTLIHSHVAVGAGASVGDDCILYPQVSIRDRVTIGHRVIVHDGVVIGSDGFGFAKQPDGTHLKIPQTADVVIEDDVEIGANSTIDRPAVGETRIRAGTKIDNLVHIAHGVAIGRRVLLAAQVGIAGSATIGDDVMMAGQTGVTGHISVGDKAIVGAKSAVLQSVEAGAFVTGSPAFPHADWRKASVVFRHLPSMKKRLEELEQRIVELEEKLAACQTDQDR